MSRISDVYLLKMPAFYKDEHSPYLIFSASANMFSIKIPYPLVGSFTKTCVTAPTNLPFWMMGEPLTTVVNRGDYKFYAFLTNIFVFVAI